MIDFKNKNILITGATGGIGNELVKKYVSLGGNVLGSGTKAEKLDELKKIVSLAKSTEKKVVFTNGCFDIIHGGHKELRNL